jgi:hypothetical protein
VTADVLAEELAANMQGIPKGAYLVLCRAIEAAGGEFRINPQEFASDALRLLPRIELIPDGDTLVVRFFSP